MSGYSISCNNYAVLRGEAGTRSAQERAEEEQKTSECLRSKTHLRCSLICRTESSDSWWLCFRSILEVHPIWPAKMYRGRPPFQGGSRSTFEGRGSAPDRPYIPQHYRDDRNRSNASYHPDYHGQSAYRRSPSRQMYPSPGNNWTVGASGERAPSSFTSLPVSHNLEVPAGSQSKGAPAVHHHDRYGSHARRDSWSRDLSPDRGGGKSRGRSRSRPRDSPDRARGKSHGRSRSRPQSPSPERSKGQGCSSSRHRSRSSSRGQNRSRHSGGRSRRSRSSSSSSSSSSGSSSNSGSSSSRSRSSYNSDNRPRTANQQQTAWYQKEMEELQNQPTKSILKKRTNNDDSPLVGRISPHHPQTSNINQFAEQLLQAVKGMEPHAVADMLSQLRSDPEMALRADLDAEIKEILTLLGQPVGAQPQLEKANDIDDEEKFLYGDCEELPAAAPSVPPHQPALDLYADVTEESLYREASSQRVLASNCSQPPPLAGILLAPPASIVDVSFCGSNIDRLSQNPALLSQNHQDPVAQEEYEKIQNLLKTIGLDLGLSDISKMAARTKERLHGNKPLKTPMRGRRYSSGSSDSSPLRAERSCSPGGDRAHSWSSEKSSDSRKLEHNRKEWNQKTVMAQTLEPGGGHALCPGTLPNYAPPQVHGMMPPAFPPYSPYSSYLPYVPQQWPAVQPPPMALPPAVPPKIHPAAQMTPPPKDEVSEKQNMESQKQKVLEEREKLKYDRDERMKKKEQLMKELESLRKQQGALLRKKRREKDGHKDPLLQDIGDMQEKLIAQIHDLRKEHEAAERKRSEIDKVALILGLSPSDRPRNTFPAKQEELKPEKIQEIRCKTPPKTLVPSEKPAPAHPDTNSVGAEDSTPSSESFEYYDAGNHWCQGCNVTSGSMFDYFTHLHSKQHRKTLDPYNRPWALPPSRTAKGAPQEKLTKPAKGSEFMLPVRGFFCLLCMQFCGDAICAEEHVTRHAHNEQYKKMTYENHQYEQRRNLDRQASLSSDHKKRKHDDGKEEQVSGRKEKKEKREKEREEKEREKKKEEEVEKNTEDGRRKSQSKVKSVASVKCGVAVDEKTEVKQEEWKHCWQAESRTWPPRAEDQRSHKSREPSANEKLSKCLDSKTKMEQLLGNGKLKLEGHKQEPAFKPSEAPKIFCGPSPAMRAKLRKQSVEATKQAASSAHPPATFGKFQWKKKESQLTREAQKMASQFIKEEEQAIKDRSVSTESSFSKSVAMAKEIALKLATQSSIPPPASRGRGKPHFRSFTEGPRPVFVAGNPADVAPVLKSTSYFAPDPKSVLQTQVATSCGPTHTGLSALLPGPKKVNLANVSGIFPSVTAPPPTSVQSPAVSLLANSSSNSSAVVNAAPTPVFKAPLPVSRTASRPLPLQATLAPSEPSNPEVSGPDVAAPGVPESEQAQTLFVKPPPFMNIGAGPPKQDKPKRNLAAAKAQDLFGIFYSIGHSGPSLIKQPPANSESSPKSPVTPEPKPLNPTVPESDPPQKSPPNSGGLNPLLSQQVRAEAVVPSQASADVEPQAQVSMASVPCDPTPSGSSQSKPESQRPFDPVVVPDALTGLQIASVWSLQASAADSSSKDHQLEAASAGSSVGKSESENTLNPECLSETGRTSPSGTLESSPNQNKGGKPKRKVCSPHPVLQTRAQTRFQTRQLHLSMKLHPEPSEVCVSSDTAAPDSQELREPVTAALPCAESASAAVHSAETTLVCLCRPETSSALQNLDCTSHEQDLPVPHSAPVMSDSGAVETLEATEKLMLTPRPETSVERR